MPQICVVLTEAEYQRIQELAAHERVSVERWVREAVRRRLVVTNPLNDFIGLVAKDDVAPEASEGEPSARQSMHPARGATVRPPLDLPENQVFVDQTAWRALVYDDHPTLREAYERLVTEGARLCTTELVLTQVLIEITKKSGSTVVKDLLVRLESSRGMQALRILYVDEKLWRDALRLWLHRYRQGNWLDVVSLAVMRQYRISQVLTLNDWFNQPGLHVLPCTAP